MDETLKLNHEETQAGAKHLGVSELVFLGFETDTLGDVPSASSVSALFTCSANTGPLP